MIDWANCNRNNRAMHSVRWWDPISAGLPCFFIYQKLSRFHHLTTWIRYDLTWCDSTRFYWVFLPVRVLFLLTKQTNKQTTTKRIKTANLTLSGWPPGWWCVRPRADPRPLRRQLGPAGGGRRRPRARVARVFFRWVFAGRSSPPPPPKKRRTHTQSTDCDPPTRNKPRPPPDKVSRPGSLSPIGPWLLFILASSFPSTTSPFTFTAVGFVMRPLLLLLLLLLFLIFGFFFFSLVVVVFAIVPFPALVWLRFSYLTLLIAAAAAVAAGAAVR